MNNFQPFFSKARIMATSKKQKHIDHSKVGYKAPWDELEAKAKTLDCKKVIAQ